MALEDESAVRSRRQRDLRGHRYDVWFASQPPAGEYQTATGAFLMVWTYKPQNRNGIGTVVEQQMSIGNQTWQLVAGRRSEGGEANAADADFTPTGRGRAQPER